MVKLFHLLLLITLASCTGSAPRYPVVEASRERVRIALQEVSDGGVHFFTYQFEGRNVDFFVRRRGSGELHAALDACYTCYKYRKGYRVQGGKIVCAKCGTGFPLEQDEWRVGGCTPIALPHETEKEHLVIKAEDLRKRARLF
jgi:uncharacterized membrane protein